MPKRVGIEWVNNYHGHASDLKNRDNCAQGFYNKISCVKAFNFGDDSAWDRDFEQSGVGSPSSGTDTSYADNVDLAYFSGHGNSGGFSFGVDTYDNRWATPGEMRLGTVMCKYLVCDSCSSMVGDAISRWGQIFTGLRAMFGFASTAHDNGDRGEIFAEYLNNGNYLDNAWRWACQETEGSDTQWGYIHVQTPSNAYSDKWSTAVSTIPNPTKLCFHSGTC